MRSIYKSYKDKFKLVLVNQENGRKGRILYEQVFS